MMLSPQSPIPNSRLHIGLLGGSFNPAHAGHLHISLAAQRILGLKKLWWLVSPQNPLKSTRGMAPFPERFESARAVAAHHRFITVSNIENTLNTRYTIDTLRKLKRRFPRANFVWLMGADNLATIHRWQEWEKIFALVPVLVLDRSPFSHSALRKKAALRFAQVRISPRALAKCKAPCWAYTHMRRHPESSTAIRARKKNTAIF